jgi:hypothetical protein
MHATQLPISSAYPIKLWEVKMFNAMDVVELVSVILCHLQTAGDDSPTLP